VRNRERSVDRPANDGSKVGETRREVCIFHSRGAAIARDRTPHILLAVFFMRHASQIAGGTAVYSQLIEETASGRVPNPGWSAQLDEFAAVFGVASVTAATKNFSVRTIAPDPPSVAAVLVESR
jgi:hypothetical protein